MLKVHTCLSCCLPSENVSESCRTGLQRENHGHIEERPSERQEAQKRRKKAGRPSGRKEYKEKERGEERDI